MEKPKSHWANNLKFLRNRKNFTQDQLAEILGISRGKLDALESGRTATPQLEDLLKFSTYFRLSVDTMLKVNLSTLSALKLRELEGGHDAYAAGSKLRVLTTTVDKDNNENAEYVPVKAKAGYVAGHTDPEFIAALPKFSLPQLPGGRTYRMFPTSGPSMLPIPENSFVVAEFVQDWRALKDDTLCIIVLKSTGADNMVFKQVENRIKKERCLILKSLNTEFAPYRVPVAEILEVWKYTCYISDTLPAAGNITMERITNALQRIQVSVDRLTAKA